MVQPQVLDVIQNLSGRVGFLTLQLAQKDSIIKQQQARLQELEEQLEPKDKGEKKKEKE
jgi:hypothetical protein